MLEMTFIFSGIITSIDETTFIFDILLYPILTILPTLPTDLIFSFVEILYP